MVQTIKFNQNTSFKFRVFLSTGETFRTEETDTLPPFPPDFDLHPLLFLVSLYTERLSEKVGR